jgi:hypothetical protein
MADESTEADIDFIYNTVDLMLRDGRFDLVDELLRQVDVKNKVDVLLAYLTLTLPAKSKLLQRASFFERVKQELTQRGEYREALLTGLE